MENRREFIQKVAAVGAAAMLPTLSVMAAPTGKQKKIRLKKGDLILFQGDSVTDWGRTEGGSVGEYGNGYVQYVAAACALRYPGQELKILNRGIGGNRVHMLRDRWQQDCIDLKPDILSILIGVNDYWHTLDLGYDGTLATYENDYRALLQQTRKALPDTKLIIGEPFALYGVGHAKESWREPFVQYQQVARKLAEEFNAPFIPYQTLFDTAAQEGLRYGFPREYWVFDGVHPSTAGFVLMAGAIMELLK